jgi:hypothetical protein
VGRERGAVDLGQKSLRNQFCGDPQPLTPGVVPEFGGRLVLRFLPGFAGIYRRPFGAPPLTLAVGFFALAASAFALSKFAASSRPKTQPIKTKSSGLPCHAEHVSVCVFSTGATNNGKGHCEADR